MSGETKAPSEPPWTIRRVLGWTAPHFEKQGVDSPRLTAEVLLAHVLGVDRVRLYVDFDRPLTKAELAAFRALISRRSAGEPTQYLTGRREFYNRSFQVDRRVLIPRPETELLVDEVLRSLPRDQPLQLLDLCTGSGCIAITLAAERPLASVFATDLSKDACDVARANAEALKVADRVTVVQGDLFQPLAPTLFDMVVANAPYVRSADIAGLSPEVRQEPHGALDGGADGLDLIRRIAAEAHRWLKPGGLLALELGETQGSAVRQLLNSEGYAGVQVEQDLARQDRLAFGRQPEVSEPHSAPLP